MTQESEDTTPEPLDPERQRILDKFVDDSNAEMRELIAKGERSRLVITDGDGNERLYEPTGEDEPAG